MDASLPLPGIAALPAAAARRARRDARHDAGFRRLLLAAAMAVAAVLLGAALATLWGGREVLFGQGLAFLTRSSWDPVAGEFGALAAVYGTLVTSAIALVLAVPTAFGVALFLTEVAPRAVRGPLAMAVELLASIPSIIYGMWGLFVFVPFMARIEPALSASLGRLPLAGALFRGPPLGLGLLTAGVVLAVMILPFMAAVMREAFSSVPRELKESARALGATTWEVAWDIVLPYTRPAVVGGIFLGLGRALGETMAVTFVLGNAFHISASLLMPGTSISSAIANEFNEAAGLHRSALLALGFLLFVVTFLVLLGARLLLRRLARREGGA